MIVAFFDEASQFRTTTLTTCYIHINTVAYIVQLFSGNDHFFWTTIINIKHFC